MCVRYKRNGQTKENPESARGINETNELKSIVRVREILTKQTNLRQSSECARYWRNKRTKDNRQSARGTNETNELKTIVRVREILAKQTN